MQGVSVSISLSQSTILFIYEWSGCQELNLEMKGETKGQRIGPQRSQRKQGYRNRCEARFQAA